MTPRIISTGLRGCVERILGGDVRPQDLHALFFSMRQESGGSGVVSEIAHFVAHPEPRTQGIATKELRDFFGFLKFRAPLGAGKIITADLPARMPDALRANLRRIRSSILKRATGASPAHAKHVLDRILARVTPTSPGGVSKLRLHDKEELAILTCIANNIKSGPLFTDADLMKDFTRILRRVGLLRQTEVAALTAQRAPLSIFAASVLHDRGIDLGDGSFAKLAIAPDVLGNLSVVGYAEVVGMFSAARATPVAICLFRTGLPISKFCELGVGPVERDFFIGDFELTTKGTLGRVPP